MLPGDRATGGKASSAVQGTLSGPWFVSAAVETTQIAPTIVKLLGLNPRDLQAVQIEHTRALPGIGRYGRLPEIPGSGGAAWPSPGAPPRHSIREG